MRLRRPRARGAMVSRGVVSPEISAMDPDAERMATRVREAIASRRLPSASRIRVHVEGGTVHLSGMVMTYFERNTCEDCCRRIEGVLVIHNSLEVEVSSRPNASVCDEPSGGDQPACPPLEAQKSGEFPVNSPHIRRGPGARISS